MYKLFFYNFGYTHANEWPTLEEAIRAAIKYGNECNIILSGERIVGPSQPDKHVGSWDFFGGFRRIQEMEEVK